MSDRSDLIAVAAILVAFLAAAALVNPVGEFPLDDDWDFSATTFTLIQTGHFQHTPFTSATAYAQELWGAAWAMLLGPHFTVLRLSTLFLSFLATLLVYAILRRARAGPRLALFAALAFLFHPLFFWASFTYMTHVPAVMASVVALLLFAVAVERGGLWIAAAIAATLASFFTRQIAILNAVVPLIVVLSLRKSIGPRWRSLAAGYAALIAAFLILLLGTKTLIASSAELQMHTPQHTRWLDLILGPPHYAFFNLQNAALFFAALLILCAAVRPARTVVAALTVLCIIIAAHMLLLARPLPYFNSGNVFADLGLGPLTLRDTFIFRMPSPHHLTYGARILLMIASTIAAAFLASIVIDAMRVRFDGNERAVLLVRYAAVYCLTGTIVVACMRLYFDRYSIDTMWPVAILLPLIAMKAGTPRWAASVATIALLVTTLFAISATAEYLAWNRARWEAFRFLRQSGVTLAQMDGGYEINAILALQTGRKDLGKRGFAVADDEYILAFNAVPGYATLRAFPYPRLLGMSTGIVYAQRRR